MPYLADQNEKEILEYWDKNKTFEKSVESRPENQPYVFYDGPPFATGLPHYGHIVASLMKDVVPRYFTMQGKRVERVWGWDCHGLPVENIVEKELGLNSKKEIEKMGIDNFNEACRSVVLKYTEEWKKTIHRMGRWVDMDHAYKTMDLPYMESVWWVFKELFDKGLLYEGYKAMHICPRCVTPLSNFEVTQGYKDVKDLSVTAKFKLKNAKEKLGLDGEVFALAWTTTPWTLPGNVALAVNKDIDYVIAKDISSGTLVIKTSNKEESITQNSGYYIFAKDRFEVCAHVHPEAYEKWMHNEDFSKLDGIRVVKGADLIGLEYEPLFPYFAETKNAFRIVAGDFVSTDDGVGIVHIAPAFGDDDYKVGQKEKIGWVQHVGMDGRFIEEVKDFAGQEVKPREEPTITDVDIIKYLAHNGKLFSKAKFEHSYPHCWRCDTPLLNYATSSWFVRVTEIKDQLLKNNEGINWVPEHIKDGRFGKWLESARDWAVSRNRFWGDPLPVWKCENEKCKNITVFGSVAELEKLSGEKITDLHKHIVDKIVFECEKCGGEMKRIPEVLDCWFESGSMPYGQMHYPFENKKKFEAGFPAEFIAEGQDQTRGWFYTLHVLATSLTSGKNPSIPIKGASSAFAQGCGDTMPAFKNVIVNGIVLAEDGKKMSKRLQNYPDPMAVLEKYGADAMRYYLVSSPVMYAENLNFSEEGVREVYNKVVNTLWNVFTFYQLFTKELRVTDYLPADRHGELRVTNNVLDKWILSKLQFLVKDMTKSMNDYKLAEASRPIMDFVLELSQWYLRRSRDRFKINDNGDKSSFAPPSPKATDGQSKASADKQSALATMREVLLTLSKLMAPFTPFIAEKIFLGLENKGSVHLENWPMANEKWMNEKVLEDMAEARKIVEASLALRKEAKIKVRQILQFLMIDREISEEFKQIIADEVNVKEVLIGDKLELDTIITEELKYEGMSREIVRAINQIRKEKSLTREKMVTVEYETADEELQKVFTDFEKEIKTATLAEKISRGMTRDPDLASGKSGAGETEVEINDKKLKLKVF